MGTTKQISDSLVIHLFALLHGVMALGCRALGLTDDIVLTLLTMVMVVLLCLRRGTSALFMGISVILVNIFGMAIGKGLALALGVLTSAPLIIFPVATFLTTEILGWSVLWLTRFGGKRQSGDAGNILWLLVAFILIICARLALLLITTEDLQSENVVASILVDYVFSCGALFFLAEYAIRIRSKAMEEERKARQVEYRYQNLRQSVNPHFLFNSLNVLDCLVTDGKDKDASAYIHKLAGIYRYLISKEEEKLVPLREEMDFVSQYVNLLQIRFGEGLRVSVDIAPELLGRKVVPCSVQLLIENATKHNSAYEDSPLRINITAAGDTLKVTNNRNPKLSKVASTGLGLKYLRQQYQDISGKEPFVSDTPEEYSVSIPLV